MKVVTQNPVLVGQEDYNGYTSNNENNPNLENSQQDINVGDISIKSSYPVIVDGRNISQNEFLYTVPSEIDGIDLTPTDDFLWSGFPGTTTSLTSYKAPTSIKNFKSTPLTETEYVSALKDVPNGPSVKEQKEKIKDGQFWNNLKGGWDKFKKTDSGQILIQSGVSYLQQALDAKNNQNNQNTTNTTDTDKDTNTSKKPMSKNTKIALISTGVILLGVIVYFSVKKK
jgi:hypothetical protein